MDVFTQFRKNGPMMVRQKGLNVDNGTLRGSIEDLESFIEMQHRTVNIDAVL